MPLSHTLICPPLKQVASLSYFRGGQIRLLEKRQNSKKTFAWANPFFEFCLFRLEHFSFILFFGHFRLKHFPFLKNLKSCHFGGFYN